MVQHQPPVFVTIHPPSPDMGLIASIHVQGHVEHPGCHPQRCFRD